ncbi:MULTISPECIES: A24 family peptidase [Sphingomonas]|uniref:A24 family peptidase n=1 Tax=Sphingomonas TaxID=13687 RepID=UPI000DEFDCA8|nr:MULTISPECIES: prepilin peptidase [Sphingomonas]
MNLLGTAPWWFVALLTLVLLVAAIQDVLVRKISNLLVLGVVLLGIAAMAYLGIRTTVWQNVVIVVALLALGTIAFSHQWLGGGDVKLFAAVGLWSNFAAAPKLLAAILISGGVVALIMLARVLLPNRESGGPLRARRSVPYGVAIAAGTLLVTWYGRLF